MNRRTALVCVSALVLPSAGCLGSGEDPAAASPTDAVREYFEAAADGDRDRANQYVHPDGAFHVSEDDPLLMVSNLTITEAEPVDIDTAVRSMYEDPEEVAIDDAVERETAAVEEIQDRYGFEDHEYVRHDATSDGRSFNSVYLLFADDDGWVIWSVPTALGAERADDSSGNEQEIDSRELLGQADPVAIRLEPEEPYEIQETDGETRVVLPERDGRELPFVSWAESIVVAGQIRTHLLDIIERDLGVRPETGGGDGLQVTVNEPTVPPRSSPALAAFDDPNESPFHLDVTRITVRDETEDTVDEPEISYERLVYTLPRSLDVTLSVEEHDEYVTRVPVVCRSTTVTVGE